MNRNFFLLSTFKLILLLFILGAQSISLFGQTESSTKVKDTTFTLVGDTLFTNMDFKIFKQQRLIIGKGSDEDGLYSTIAFGSPFSWPIWLFRDAEIKNNYDYQTDQQKRINDKVREYLIPGDTLIVTKIKSHRDKYVGHWYAVFLRTTKFPRVKFFSNIENSIKWKELLIPK